LGVGVAGAGEGEVAIRGHRRMVVVGGGRCSRRRRRDSELEGRRIGMRKKRSVRRVWLRPL
jgi:hypothetical protein